MTETTFDDLIVRRPKLAQSYLKMLEAQPGRPIALFAPRRVGKTFFLQHDLAPQGKKAGLVPVYTDLWLMQSDPLAAINHALMEALESATIPKTSLGRTAKTPVKKLGVLGASIEFGEAPAVGTLPEKVELRLDTLVTRLHEATRKPVLLMLDEVQQLGEIKDGAAAIATLRAVLQKRRTQVRAIFTGSSQDGLAAMVVASGGPMYQFAQMIDFPALGEEYLNLLAEHFASVHPRKKLRMDDLVGVFAHIGFKPDLMKDLVKWMSAEGSIDIGAALKRMINDDNQQAGWRALLSGIPQLDIRLLTLIAQGASPFAKATMNILAAGKAGKVTIAQVRAALDRLRKARILTRPASGEYVIEDRLFADFLVGAAETDR